MKESADIQQQIELDKNETEKKATEKLTVPNSANKPMDKFQRLLKKIQTYNEITLDLTDFGLESNQTKELVDQVNARPSITLLILCHNGLNNNATKFLINLKHVKTLDISYNNFTSESISQLLDINKFRLNANYNNTLHATIKDKSDTLMFQQPLAKRMTNTFMMAGDEQKKTDKIVVAKKNILLQQANQPGNDGIAKSIRLISQIIELIRESKITDIEYMKKMLIQAIDDIPRQKNEGNNSL